MMLLYCFSRYFRLENITSTTQTSASLEKDAVTISTSRMNSRQTTMNLTWPTTEASFQQVSTSMIEENNTTSSKYYFQPGFFPDEDRPRLDNDDVFFYVDPMLGEEDNSTRRYHDDDYVDLDDDDLRVRDLERVVVESAATSRRNRVTSSTARDLLFTPVTSPSATGGRQPGIFTDSELTMADTGRRQPSSVSSSIPSATTSKNSPENDEDWWRQFPFMGSVLTTTLRTSSANTVTATDFGTSTTAADDITSSSTTLRSTMPSLSRVSDGEVGTEPSTSQVLGTWIITPFVPSRHTTSSYLQHGYIDLDNLDDHHQLDMAVEQSGTDGVLEPGASQVMTSTGIVLLVSIAVASLLLLAVIVLLVFYHYGRAFPETASLDCFPTGCRRYLIACGLGPAAVTRVATEETSPPPNATSVATDDRRTTFPSKCQRLSAGTVVVTATQIKHSPVQKAANSQGVIEWYV